MLPSNFDGIIDGCDVCLIWALFLHYFYAVGVLYLYTQSHHKKKIK
jgi:hypothetical protein